MNRPLGRGLAVVAAFVALLVYLSFDRRIEEASDMAYEAASTAEQAASKADDLAYDLDDVSSRVDALESRSTPYRYGF